MQERKHQDEVNDAKDWNYSTEMCATALLEYQYLCDVFPREDSAAVHFDLRSGCVHCSLVDTDLIIVPLEPPCLDDLCEYPPGMHVWCFELLPTQQAQLDVSRARAMFIKAVFSDYMAA